MGLFDTLLKTATHIITIPIDIVEDTGNLLNGEVLPSSRKKIKKLAEDASEGVKNIVDVDP